MIESGLYDLLSTNTTFMSVCKGLYMNTIPEGAPTPSVSFKVVSAVIDVTMDGNSGYVERRYQFTCTGRDSEGITTTATSGYTAAKTLQEALRVLMENTLTLPMTLSDGTYVFNVIRSMEVDFFDSESQVHHATTDYYVTFRQV